MFLAAVKEEHSSNPLPEPLDERMVTASHVFTSKYFLNKEGKWGHQVSQGGGSPLRQYIYPTTGSCVQVTFGLAAFVPHTVYSCATGAGCLGEVPGLAE